MKKIFRFKVTSRGGYSTTIPHRSDYCVLYELNKWVEAKVGGLLVFSELESAYDFLSYTSRELYKLWLCECERKIIMPPKRVSYMGPIDSKGKGIDFYIEELWTPGCKSVINDSYLASWPENTESYQRIKLIKELNW